MFLKVFLLVLSFQTAGWAEEYAAFPEVGMGDPASLKEAARVLDVELKLATRPQAYLLIDLVSARVEIKARGMTLYRMSVVEWSGSSSGQMTDIFRLKARPPVVRRKMDPSSSAEQEPVSLEDMPMQYLLSFTPSLTVEIISVDHNQWIWSQGKQWWRQLQRWGMTLVGLEQMPTGPSLQLTLSVDQAQSLAWSLVDGMALVVRRPP
jgi:hypothetical protein